MERRIIEMEGLFVVIEFPEIQKYMDMDGFEENSYLVSDEKGLEDFGSSAYFVSLEWINNQK